MKIINEAKKRSSNFLLNETQFHLGMMPTEQSNSKTTGLDQVFKANTESGVAMLLSVDEDILPMAKQILNSKEFSMLLKSSYKAINNNGKIIFSGCGATGRLSILLESMWRRFFRQLKYDNIDIYNKIAQFEDTVFSIMTGGDYALIKSVESFEDYPQFGKSQVQELKINSKDVLIAITEGGETSSVLGSIAEAINVGAKAFLLFNNPANLLCKHIERSKRIIENPAVIILDLFCGPMAIAGSTRMQATTSEQLIAGVMLEKLLSKILRDNLSIDEFASFPNPEIDYVVEMKTIITDLKSKKALEAISEYIHYEKNVYKKNGLVTYFVDEFLIDIFTDTTERAPTFMIPPFRKYNDLKFLPSWSFVKTPLFSTETAWEHYLGRELRCLEWTINDYIQMQTPEHILKNPPSVSKKEMIKFFIGNEEEQSRFESPESAAVMIFSGNEFNEKVFSTTQNLTKKFAKEKLLIISESLNSPENALVIPGLVKPTPLKLMDHMKVKLTLNTISTGTMVLLGRIKSNWMSYVSMSNKKLIDRSIRLIAELGDLSYEDACLALHCSIVELEQIDFTGKEEPSPVQYTLDRINT